MLSDQPVLAATKQEFLILRAPAQALATTPTKKL